jgi:hypothetical protein
MVTNKTFKREINYKKSMTTIINKTIIVKVVTTITTIMVKVDIQNTEIYNFSLFFETFNVRIIS